MSEHPALKLAYEMLAIMARHVVDKLEAGEPLEGMNDYTCIELLGHSVDYLRWHLIKKDPKVRDLARIAPGGAERAKKRAALDAFRDGANEYAMRMATEIMKYQEGSPEREAMVRAVKNCGEHIHTEIEALGIGMGTS